MTWDLKREASREGSKRRDRTQGVHRGLKMKELRDLKDLTIHDVKPIIDSYSADEVPRSVARGAGSGPRFGDPFQD